MVRVVGRAPADYNCPTCPAHLRGARRCKKLPEGCDPWEELRLQEARRAGQMPPADHTHPDACPVARIEATPRALDALEWATSWREHGDGPAGRGLSWQPLLFLDGQAHLAHETEAMLQEQREAAEADQRAVQAGVRLPAGGGLPAWANR